MDDDHQSASSDVGANQAPERGAAEPAASAQDLSNWRGKDLFDRDGERLGKLQDVYFDLETDEPQFGTVKEGLFNRHLTFLPLVGVTIRPDSLQVAVTKEQVKAAPNIDREGDQLSAADESALYHHYQLNYTPTDNASGRRLVRH